MWKKGRPIPDTACKPRPAVGMRTANEHAGYDSFRTYDETGLIFSNRASLVGEGPANSWKPDHHLLRKLHPSQAFR